MKEFICVCIFLVFISCVPETKLKVSTKCDEGQNDVDGVCIVDDTKLFQGCDNIIHGESISRIMYQTSTVDYGLICMVETQTSICSDGEMSFYTGTFEYQNCLVLGQVEDIVPPVIIESSPIGSLSASTTTVQVNITTDENSTCRYSETSSISYDNMTYFLFSDDGINHRSVNIGVSSGSSYIYYIRCQDSLLNENDVDYLISFSIQSSSSLNTSTTSINGNTTIDSNGHSAGGQKHLARVGDTVIALVSNGGQYTYRSLDSGETWELIDEDGTTSGCLVQSNDYIYHFYRSSADIMMVKFAANDLIIPEPVSIYHDIRIASTGTGLYKSVTGTIDSSGKIYLATHFINGVGGDSMYVIVSNEAVDSWQLVLVKQDTADNNFTDPSIQVSPDNTIYLSFSTFQDQTEMSFLAISENSGLTWTDLPICNEGRVLYNTHVLPTGPDELYIFAQSSNGEAQGLVFIKSVDSGATWSEWRSIDSSASSYNNYADPSAALAENGDIYVAYRSSSIPVGAANNYFSRLARSTDGGVTWDFPFFWTGGNSMEIKSSLRYQTFFNGGGPIEYVWMQNDGSTPTWYHKESANIFNIQSGN